MMMQIIFAIAIAFNAQYSNAHSFVYVELHNVAQYDEYEFMQTYNACYENNDTQRAIDECVNYAINSYSRTNA